MADPDEGYTTLAGPCEVAIDRIRRSRFIAMAAPVREPDGAASFVSAARARFHDARHHPFAWRLADTSRASDDGEPRHSAGLPILREIEGRGLRGVVVVVARYFGGVKLGTGGLARAFGAAAAAVLDAAETRRLSVRTPISVRVPYSGLPAVQAALRSLGLEPAHADYTEAVHLILHLPPSRVQEAISQLRDATGGAAILEPSDPIVVSDR